MTDPLPGAALADHLTDTLRRCGVLGSGRVCDVAVENSRDTILSRIIRLRISYDGVADQAAVRTSSSRPVTVQRRDRCI